jgi:hypothetical protein
MENRMKVPTEEQVVKSLADYENTTLLYNDINIKIRDLCRDTLEYDERELTKLNQIRDDIISRFRLNPFVDEVEGEYKFWSPIELVGLKEQGWF